MTDTVSAINWRAFGDRLRGRIVLAGEPDMVLANKHYAAQLPLAPPRVLVRCGTRDDVRRTLALFTEKSVPFAIRSGGHCFGDLSASKSAILDLECLNTVRIKGDHVQAGPGALAGDLSRELAGSGRVLPTGGCPLVAIGGLALAGGFGFLGRRFGLVTDQLLEAEVLCADGRIVKTSRTQYQDLFWALRGAGAAGFGVVTSLTLKTAPSEPILACNGRWSLNHAVDIIDLWQHWMPDAPHCANLELSLMEPASPGDDCFLELYGVVLGAEASGIVSGLREALGTRAAELKCWKLEPVAAAEYLVGLRNRQTDPAWLPSRPYAQVGCQATRSQFFEHPVDIEGIRTCITQFQADRRSTEMREIEFIPWGGAYAFDDGSACFLHRKPRTLVRHTVLLGARSTPESRDHGRNWVDASAATLQPFANGHVYQGYADMRLANWQHAYFGDAYPRLQKIKRKFDPDNIFRHPQSVTATEGER